MQPYNPQRSYWYGSRGLTKLPDAKRVSKNFRSAARYALSRGRWRYRPVHSFVHALQNDWEDRALAEAVLRAVDEYLNLYGLYQTQYDQFDVPRDHVGDETGPGDY